MLARDNTENFPHALPDMILAQSFEAIIIIFIYFFINKKIALERLSELPKILQQICSESRFHLQVS